MADRPAGGRAFGRADASLEGKERLHSKEKQRKRKKKKGSWGKKAIPALFFNPK
jgi:hypothetical protein